MNTPLTNEELDELERDLRGGNSDKHLGVVSQRQLRTLISLARKGLEAEWQDIESAPKDEVDILIYAAGRVGIGFWNEHMNCWQIHDTERDGWLTDRDGEEGDALYWQPLPEPPQEVKG